MSDTNQDKENPGSAQGAGAARQEPAATLQIHFGVLSEPLRKQLKPYRVSAKAIRGLQAKADAITRLYITAILTEGETKNARRRLFGEIKALAEACGPRRPS